MGSPQKAHLAAAAARRPALEAFAERWRALDDPTPLERYDLIMEARRGKVTLLEIAGVVGVSKQRVQMICARPAPAADADGKGRPRKPRPDWENRRFGKPPAAASVWTNPTLDVMIAQTAYRSSNELMNRIGIHQRKFHSLRHDRARIWSEFELTCLADYLKSRWTIAHALLGEGEIDARLFKRQKQKAHWGYIKIALEDELSVNNIVDAFGVTPWLVRKVARLHGLEPSRQSVESGRVAEYRFKWKAWHDDDEEQLAKSALDEWRADVKIKTLRRACFGELGKFNGIHSDDYVWIARAAQAEYMGFLPERAQ